MRIVAVYLICTLLVTVFPKKRVIFAFLINSVAIAWLAYSLSTTNQYDLIFHLDLYNYLSGKELQSVFSHYYFKQSPVYVLYVYFLGFFKNEHLLPAISTFIGYFSFSYVLYYFIKRDDLAKTKYISIYLLILFTLPWQDFSAGIRGALAFSIFSLAVFFDLVEKNVNFGLVFYFVAVFIHPSAIIALFVRVLLHFTKRLNKGSFYIICGCLLLFSSLSTIISYLLTNLANSTGLSILSVIAQSFESYVIRGKELYEYSIVIIRAAITLMVLFVIFSCGIRVDDNDIDRNHMIIRYYLLFVCITFSYIGQYDIFCRYSVASILLLPMVLCCCEDAPITFKLGNILDRSYGFVLVSFSTLVLVFYYVIYYSKWVFGG